MHFVGKTLPNLQFGACRASQWNAHSSWRRTPSMFSPPSPGCLLSFSASSLGSFEISHLFFASLYLFLTIRLFPSAAITLSLFLVMVRLFCDADATWAPFYGSAPFVLFIWQASPRIVPGYQRSPADRVTACVRLWPISGFTFKSDSYHYLRDK